MKSIAGRSGGPVCALTLSLWVGLTVGCEGKGGQDQALAGRLNEATAKVVDCQNRESALKEEIGKLKRDLAEAMANPARVTLNDPEIIELVAKIKGERAAAASKEPEEVSLGKGDLDPRQASKIILQGASALQACYERALKRNTALQMRTGLGVMLGLTIKATGKVQDVNIHPSVDKEMTECMKGAATRWKFPPFAGQAVSIEQKLQLTPKN